MAHSSLARSASYCSLDISNHFVINLEAPRNNDLWKNQETTKNGRHYDVDSVFGSNNEEKGKMHKSPSMLFELIVQEEAHKAVSCQRIEMNLIADAKRREEDSNKAFKKLSKGEKESYWDMPSDCDSFRDNNVYCSTGQVERLLVEDALRRIEEAKKLSEPIVETNSQHDAYWNWSAEPVLGSEKKMHSISLALVEEITRQNFSIDFITNIEMAASVQMSTDYWFWNTQEEKQEYIAPHVHDPSHPNNAYWDFPSETDDPKALKAKLIEKILNEERIRTILSSDAIEAREVEFHRLKKENQKLETSTGLNLSKSSNYWDWGHSPASDPDTVLSSEKQELINRLLKIERQRFVLSTENIENNLRLASEKMSSYDLGKKSSPVSSYWDW